MVINKLRIQTQFLFVTLIRMELRTICKVPIADWKVSHRNKNIVLREYSDLNETFQYIDGFF